MPASPTLICSAAWRCTCSRQQYLCCPARGREHHRGVACLQGKSDRLGKQVAELHQRLAALEQQQGCITARPGADSAAQALLSAQTPQPAAGDISWHAGQDQDLVSPATVVLGKRHSREAAKHQDLLLCAAAVLGKRQSRAATADGPPTGTAASEPAGLVSTIPWDASEDQTLLPVPAEEQGSAIKRSRAEPSGPQQASSTTAGRRGSAAALERVLGPVERSIAASRREQGRDHAGGHVSWRDGLMHVEVHCPD